MGIEAWFGCEEIPFSSNVKICEVMSTSLGQGSPRVQAHSGYSVFGDIWLYYVCYDLTVPFSSNIVLKGTTQ